MCLPWGWAQSRFLGSASSLWGSVQLAPYRPISSGIWGRPPSQPQVVWVVKNPPAGAGDVRDVGSIPRLGRSPGGGHGHPLQYSCLENPHGQRSLADCSPRGRKESDTTAVTEHACMSQHLCSPWPVSTRTRAVDRLQWLSPILLTGPTPALKLPHRDCNSGQDAAEGSKAMFSLPYFTGNF